MIKILAVGDVFGTPGSEFIRRRLRAVKQREGADLVIVNGENASAGNAIGAADAQLIFDSGADVITGGNHSLRKYDIFDYSDETAAFLRPLNFPAGAPGHGWCIVPVKNGLRVLVISAAGQIFMDPADSPFSCTERVLAAESGNYDIAVCDFHAEATSEKKAFFRFFDGRINIAYGTHTHVATADETLTDRGCAYITDIGMCGDEDSVIGVTYESAMERYITGVRRKGIAAGNNVTLRGAVFTVDETTLFVTDVKRIKYNEGSFK